MKEIIGTGPYKFVEHLPDRHARAVRFDNYAAAPTSRRDGRPQDGLL